jgi:light-harvesting complex 1 alpha chain
MWKIWLIFDPRRSLVAILTFAFVMVMINHFIQLSTPRYGSWLNEPRAGSVAPPKQSATPAPVAANQAQATALAAAPALAKAN